MKAHYKDLKILDWKSFHLGLTGHRMIVQLGPIIEPL